MTTRYEVGRRAVPVIACLLVAGCAGNGDGLDANGRPLGSGGGGGVLTATYDSIQSNVFTPICTVCHAGGGAPQGLRLDAANAYTLLVGIPSTEVPSVLRVDPGNPDSSYIIQKLEGHAAVGAQMPFGGPPLPGSTIAVIRQWITDGAPRGAGAAAASFTIDTVVPVSGEVVSAPPQIMVSFNRELDATRLQAETLRLEHRNAKDAWERVTTRLALVETARALMLTPLKALAPGRYRVLMDDEPAAVMLDLAGHALTTTGPAGGTPLSEFVVTETP